MEEFDDIVAGRDAAPEPLTDAYRVIRPLSPAEHPVPAVLAHGPDGPVALADGRDLDSWPGWELRGHHVLAPMDVARTAGGHAVVLPWCRHRLTADWASRELTGGQAVTLAVSMMRGALEARRGARGTAEGPPGAWWADDDGRPLFAAATPVADGDDSAAEAQRRKRGTRHEPRPRAPGESAAASAAALLAVVAERMPDRVVRRLLDRVIGLLAEPAQLAREIDGFEAELFEACAPQPLDFTAPHERETDAVPDTGRLARRFAPATRRGRARDASHARAQAPRARSTNRMGQVVGAVRSAARAVAESARPALRGRRAAYAAGGVAAVAVLLVGVFWPSGEPAAQADGPAPAAAADGGERVSGQDARRSARSDADTPLATGGASDGDGAERPDSSSPLRGRDSEAEGESSDRDGAEESDPSDSEQGGDSEAEGDSSEGDGAEAGEANDESSEAEGAEEGSAAEDIDAEVSADPVEAAARLVARAAECGDDCEGVFAEGAASGPDAAPWRELARGEVSLVDDYGGVTLVKAGEGAGAHYLSLVLSDGRWLLRDAYPAG